jgi:hypothetical protein
LPPVPENTAKTNFFPLTRPFPTYIYMDGSGTPDGSGRTAPPRQKVNRAGKTKEGKTL